MGEVAARYRPALYQKSCGFGRAHLFYRDVQVRGNCSWSAMGASGEVRSGAGYVVLWQGLDALAGVVAAGPGGVPFPIEALLLRREVKKRDDGETADGEGPAELGRSGANKLLFDTLRLWAYDVPSPPIFDLWFRLLCDRASWIARQEGLGAVLRRSEVLAVAASVATGIWRQRVLRRVSLGRSSAVQRQLIRWYGRSDDGGVSRLQWLEARDLGIARRVVDEGVPSMLVAAESGLSQRHVNRIVDMYCRLLSSRKEA